MRESEREREGEGVCEIAEVTKTERSTAKHEDKYLEVQDSAVQQWAIFSG